jgi:uncharacterized membrane protein
MGMKEKAVRAEKGPEQKAAPGISKETAEEDDSIYNAIIIACLIGIVIIAGLILTSREPEGFTELYLLNYTERPVDGQIYMRYGISSHENTGVLYEIIAKIGNETAAQEIRWLKDNQTEIKEIYLPYNQTGTQKVMLELYFLNQTQEVHFWMR